jgi:ribosome-binding ATPase YchF (GTP1/OBG family)
LLEINEDIVEKDKQLKIDYELTKALEEELTKRLHNTEKNSKKVKEDYDNLQEEITQLKEQSEHSLQQKVSFFSSFLFL